MSKPSVDFVWASNVHSSLTNAKCWTPKAEWDDIKCYVEKPAYDFAVDQWDYFVEQNEKNKSKLQFAIEELKASLETLDTIQTWGTDPTSTAIAAVAIAAIERIDKFLKENE